MDLELGCVGDKIADWYKSREWSTWYASNFGVGSSHELARSSVFAGFKFETGDVKDVFKSRINQDWALKKPDIDDGNKILALVDKGMQDCALAVCSTLGYMRYGVSAREVFERSPRWPRLGSVPSPFMCAVRLVPEVEEVGGNQELLATIAAALGYPAIVCYLNNPGYNLVHELLVNLQNRGMNVWGKSSSRCCLLGPCSRLECNSHRYLFFAFFKKVSFILAALVRQPSTLPF